MRYAYPYELSAQPEGGFTVTFPDVPEAITQGETEAEAAAMAEDALVTALSFYADDAEPLPYPSPAHGRRLAYVPPLVAAKLALHDAMLAAGVSNVLLARRLGADEKIVRRLRDPLHKSRIDQVGEALRSLGKVIEVVVREADAEQGAASPEPGSPDRPRDNSVYPQSTPEVRAQVVWSKKHARTPTPSRPVSSERYCSRLLSFRHPRNQRLLGR
jgi:antitoxin HicB